MPNHNGMHHWPIGHTNNCIRFDLKKKQPSKNNNNLSGGIFQCLRTGPRQGASLWTRLGPSSTIAPSIH